jgi:hypothetical protein
LNARTVILPNFVANVSAFLQQKGRTVSGVFAQSLTRSIAAPQAASFSSSRSKPRSRW